MTTFSATFNTPGAPSVSATGIITLSLKIDAAAGARQGTIWGAIGGNGSISNYLLKAPGHVGFPHAGSDSSEFVVGVPDINGSWSFNGPWGVDTLTFDGSASAASSQNSNGLNFDGTTITGTIKIFADGLTAPFGQPNVTLNVTLSAPIAPAAVPTLYNLAEMSEYLEHQRFLLPTGWAALATAQAGPVQVLALINSDASQIVIVMPATVFDLGTSAGRYTIFADINSLGDPQGHPDDNFRAMVTAASQLLFDVHQQHSTAQITITGHSLGGALAQLVGRASGYPTVAFDAPGSMFLYNDLATELKPAADLASLNPIPGGNVDIRVVGDGISLINRDAELNPITLLSNSQVHASNGLVVTDSGQDILANHGLDILRQRLMAPDLSLYQNIQETSTDVNNFAASLVAIASEKNTFIKAAKLWHFNNEFNETHHYTIDPGAGSLLVVSVSGNSPAITSVSFFTDPDIASYRVWSLAGGAWSTPQTVAAGVSVTFGAGTHAVKFEALNSSGQTLSLPDGFLFDATFAAAGQVDGGVQNFDFDKLDGTNVQTPAPGQTTLTVGASFNYTDAGNGNLTVNGTAAGNDTILLGSGTKTVNLGGGNDFVMVKAGLTGNIAVHGGPGDETILAGAANVTLLAGSGNILFTGGDDANANAGFNMIDYSALAGAVSVNLSTGIVRTGNAAITTLVNVENVTGSPSGDTLAGDSRANTLSGGAGNDTLTGGGGNDRLDGGPGTDTAVYNAAIAAFALASYNATVAVLTHGADGDDRLQGIENIQFTDKTVAAGTAAVFDPWEYLASYPDLIRAFGANPQAGFDHYVDSGFVENRATNLFDPLEYLASNGDLIRAFGLNPVAAEQHYVVNGFNEHRATNLFDPLEYLASNGDLIRAFGLNLTVAEQHYVQNGFNEHRATASFDPLEYLASNGDLIHAFGLNLTVAEQHYVVNGFNEHRATASFDPLEYLASNGDLIHAFGLNLTVAEQHYVQNGFNEHRATASFDPLEYLASNGDLIHAFGLNLVAAEQHYVVNGFNEHRSTTSFDAAQYLANYSDLTAAFGPNNLVAAEQHFITNGFNEGRTDKAPVITGNAANNTLVAKNGAIMTGGAGADLFVFNFPLQKSAVITDFAAGADHLEISAAGFGHGLAAGGSATLVAAATAASASHAGTGGYFIFDNAGTVWWDQTGGSGADAIALAKLTGVAALHASDFLLV